VRARDTALLLAGVIVVALVPWCLPLWWQLHRLRDAIETDCDARVLEAADPGEYASALLAVAGSGASRRPPLPVTALGPRRGELERRIRLITAGSRGRSRARGLVLVAGAMAAVAGAALLPVPDLPSIADGAPSGEEGAPVPPSGPVPSASVLFSIGD
jgi:beta-lactamase regulating signal transducer with metallopeptidase domain